MTDMQWLEGFTEKARGTLSDVNPQRDLPGIVRPFRKGRLRVEGQLQGGLWPGVPSMPLVYVGATDIVLGGAARILLRIKEWEKETLAFAGVIGASCGAEHLDTFAIPKNEWGWALLSSECTIPHIQKLLRGDRGVATPEERAEAARAVVPWILRSYGEDEICRFLPVDKYSVYHIFVPKRIREAMTAMAMSGWTPLVPNWAGRMGHLFNRAWHEPCSGNSGELKWSQRVHLELHEQKLCQFPVGAFNFDASGYPSLWEDLPEKWVEMFCNECYRMAAINPSPEQQPWLHDSASNVPLLLRDDVGLKMFKIRVKELKVTATEVPLGDEAALEGPEEEAETPAVVSPFAPQPYVFDNIGQINAVADGLLRTYRV